MFNMTGPRSGHQRQCNIATGYAYENFSKVLVYCHRVYFLCTERIATGSGFRPPAAHPPPPPSTWKSSAPPPPREQVLHNLPYWATIDIRTYSLNKKEWICSLFKEWILEKSEIRVNLEWTFVLFTHFGVTSGITRNPWVIPVVTPKWVNNTNVHSNFTLF